MHWIYKAATPAEISYITKTSKLRVGSLAFIVPFDKPRSTNAVDCIAITVRSGKKGRNMLVPVDLTIRAVDFEKILQKEDLEIYNLVRHRENLYEPIDKPSILRKATAYAELTPVEIESRDLLRWDVWQFIGFIAAKSMSLSINHIGGAGSVAWSVTSINRYALRKDIHIVDKSLALSAITGTSIHNLWRILLRQTNFDKRFKSSEFTNAMIEYFSSSANRIAKLNELHKYMSGISQKVSESQQQIEEDIGVSVRYVKECVEYYKRRPEAIEELKSTGISNLERFSRSKVANSRPLKRTSEYDRSRHTTGRIKEIKCPNCFYDLAVRLNICTSPPGHLNHFESGGVCPVCLGRGTVTKKTSWAELLDSAVINNSRTVLEERHAAIPDPSRPENNVEDIDIDVADEAEEYEEVEIEEEYLPQALSFEHESRPNEHQSQLTFKLHIQVPSENPGPHKNVKVTLGGLRGAMEVESVEPDSELTAVEKAAALRIIDDAIRNLRR